MFKTKIDNLYNLCKRVVNERPDMYCSFDLTTHGVHVLLYKDGNNAEKRNLNCVGIFTRIQGFWKLKTREIIK